MKINGDDLQCSSNAVDSSIRAGITGGVWGLCAGPFEARRLGLTGGARALFEAKSMARCGLQCGIFVGIFSVARCELKRYRGKEDMVSTFIAGGLAGAIAGPGFGNLVSAGASMISLLFVAAENKKAN